MLVQISMRHSLVEKLALGVVMCKYPPLCCCLILGYMAEVCHIPCPLDCKLSDWSAWSACSASCGSGLQMRSKWLREKAFNRGRPCPRLDLKNQVGHVAARLCPCHKIHNCVLCGDHRQEHSWPVHPSTLFLCDIWIYLFNCFQGNKSFWVSYSHIHRITTCHCGHAIYA